MAATVAMAMASLMAALVPTAEAQIGTLSSRDLNRRISAFAQAPEVHTRLVTTPPAGLAVLGVDAREGVPTLIAGRGLRGPSAILAPTPQHLADHYLRALAPAYGLGPLALRSAHLRQLRQTPAGGTVAVYDQQVGGVEVLDSRVTFLIDARGDLVAAGGHLERPVAAGPYPFMRTREASAAVALADHFGGAVQSGTLLRQRSERGSSRYYQLTSAGASAGYDLRDDLRVKEVLYPMPRRLIPAHYLELWAPDPSGETVLVAYVVSAEDGTILDRRGLTDYDSFQYRVYADPTAPHLAWDSPWGDLTPDTAGMPVTFTPATLPAYVPAALVTIEGFNTNPMGMPDPWLPAGATETTGNNVDAFANIAAPDGFNTGDVRSTVTAPGVFGHVFDPALPPNANNTQIQAVVNQLFYQNNWLHDYFYDVGFDEAAGNAQANNFGRGGEEGDAIRAQAMDYAGRNNANMNTPADGSSPRMRMYLWDGLSERGVTANGATFSVGVASWGPTSFDLTMPSVLVNDGVGTVTDGCSPIGMDLSGRIALIDRGTCNFTDKVLNAQDAGAVGVIVMSDGRPLTTMGGTPTRPVTIPALLVLQEDGTILRTPPELGGPTRIFRSEGNDAPSSLDATVLTHEWGHYIHHRLGSPGSTQSGGQGEGWGDFLGIFVLARAGDDLDGAYPGAGFSNHGDTPIYFGTRRYPYSRNRAFNDLSFRHISDGEPMPMGPPTDPSSAPNSEVHNAGEIWATMMFDAFLALVDRSRMAGAPYDFEEAKRRMAAYVVTGLQLAPRSPTFTEQRDAIILAAIESDLDDAILIAEAFAGRGAGTCAVSPDRFSTDNTGVVEDFMVRARGAIEGIEVVVDDGGRLCDDDTLVDGGETGIVRVTVRNLGVLPISGATLSVVADHPSVTTIGVPIVLVPDLAPGEVTTVELGIAVDEAAPPAVPVNLEATMSEASFCDSTALTARVPFDRDLGTTALEDFEEEPPWLNEVSIDGTTTGVWRVEAGMLGDPDQVLHGDDTGSQTDTAMELPEVQASATDPLVLSFEHRFEFEPDPADNWDGGLIELSTDGGMTWVDVSDYVDPGYYGALTNPVNPLHPRRVYTQRNPSFPSADRVTLDFGTTFAGMNVRFRFRIGTDAAAGATGWEIDELSITGTTAEPFPTLIPDGSSCADAPIADAGPDQTVYGDERVTLTGEGSSDPSGDPITFEWELLTPIPGVDLDNPNDITPSFTSPILGANAVLTFRVRVSDGRASDTDEVDITVLAGTRPEPDAGMPPTPDSGTPPGRDAGMPGTDGGMTDTDAGTMPRMDGGCGCSIPGQDAPSGRLPLAATLILGLGLWITRRRRS